MGNSGPDGPQTPPRPARSNSPFFLRLPGKALKYLPNPEHFFNDNNGDSNQTLTPGGLGRVTGHRLNFDPADEQQGVFLTPVTGGSVTRVDTYARITSRELIFMVPAGLAPGDYTLKVRAVFGQHLLRSGEYQEVLAVI